MSNINNAAPVTDAPSASDTHEEASSQAKRDGTPGEKASILSKISFFSKGGKKEHKEKKEKKRRHEKKERHREKEPDSGSKSKKEDADKDKEAPVASPQPDRHARPSTFGRMSSFIKGHWNQDKEQPSPLTASTTVKKAPQEPKKETDIRKDSITLESPPDPEGTKKTESTDNTKVAGSEPEVPPKPQPKPKHSETKSEPKVFVVEEKDIDRSPRHTSPRNHSSSSSKPHSSTTPRRGESKHSHSGTASSGSAVKGSSTRDKDRDAVSSKERSGSTKRVPHPPSHPRKTGEERTVRIIENEDDKMSKKRETVSGQPSSASPGESRTEGEKKEPPRKLKLQDDLERFLNALELGQYYMLFQVADVNYEKILKFTAEDLKEFKLPVPAKRKLLDEIAKINSIEKMKKEGYNEKLPTPRTSNSNNPSPRDLTSQSTSLLLGLDDAQLAHKALADSEKAVATVFDQAQPHVRGSLIDGPVQASAIHGSAIEPLMRGMPTPPSSTPPPRGPIHSKSSDNLQRPRPSKPTPPPPVAPAVEPPKPAVQQPTAPTPIRGPPPRLPLQGVGGASAPARGSPTKVDAAPAPMTDGLNAAPQRDEDLRRQVERLRAKKKAYKERVAALERRTQDMERFFRMHVEEVRVFAAAQEASFHNYMQELRATPLPAFWRTRAGGRLRMSFCSSCAESPPL